MEEGRGRVCGGEGINPPKNSGVRETSEKEREREEEGVNPPKNFGVRERRVRKSGRERVRERGIGREE